MYNSSISRVIVPSMTNEWYYRDAIYYSNGKILFLPTNKRSPCSKLQIWVDGDTILAFLVS